jgi:sugar O-acyltransferase (sialic acid O-acetyltransferase NeuD family)
LETVYIFGTGGFARETQDIARVLGLEGIFIASSETERDAWRGPEAVILEDQIDAKADAAFAIGIGDNAVRAKIAARYSDRLHFVNLIHPSATFGKDQLDAIERHRGVIVCAGVRFTNNIEVGDFTIFNLNATIGHDVIVEDFVNIAPGANVSGCVHLCERVWIGTNAAINQGSASQRLLVGSGTVIGSGSVVVRDCEPNSIYVGIPAKKR